MANFTRIRLPGFWVNGSVVDAAEFEAIDSIRPMLVNASGGSTHAPSALITLGGSGLTVSGPSQLTNLQQANIPAAGLVAFATGSILGVSGEATWAAGSAMVKDATSTWTMNGTISFVSSTLSGSITYPTGTTVTWGASNWPLLSSRTVTRRGWRLGWTAYTGGSGTSPGTPLAWAKISNVGGSGAAAIQTREETASNAFGFVVELTDLVPGSTLNTVTIKTKGTAGDGTLNLPTYTLLRWLDTGTSDPMSAGTTDTHTTGNWQTDILDTVLTCNANQVIDSAYRYGINCSMPYGTTAAAMQMYSFISSATATKIQL